MANRFLNNHLQKQQQAAIFFRFAASLENGTETYEDFRQSFLITYFRALEGGSRKSADHPAVNLQHQHSACLTVLTASSRLVQYTC